MMIDLPTLGIVIGSAAIDSINPCAIGMLILMIIAVLGNGHSSKRLLLLGSAYIFAIFTAYLIAGMGLVYFLSELPTTSAGYISLGLGVLIALVGILKIKDYFWYGRGFSLKIPKKIADKIQDYSKSKMTFLGAVTLGVLVAVAELLCTGAPYVAVIAIVSLEFNLAAFGLMALYSFIFILPLLVILLLVVGGAKVSSVAKWKEESKGTMRLLIGLLLVFLAWLLILTSSGMINLG